MSLNPIWLIYDTILACKAQSYGEKTSEETRHIILVELQWASAESSQTIIKSFWPFVEMLWQVSS